MIKSARHSQYDAQIPIPFPLPPSLPSFNNQHVQVPPKQRKPVPSPIACLTYFTSMYIHSCDSRVPKYMNWRVKRVLVYPLTQTHVLFKSLVMPDVKQSTI